MEIKIKQLIEQLVYQVLKEELPEPEANEEDPFGKYLFGQKRKLPEPDTREENYFEKSFEDFVLGNEHSSLSQMLPELIKLKNEGKYSEYLQPPQGNVWRIISGLTVGAASSILNVSPEIIQTMAKQDRAILSPVTGFTYASGYGSRNVASWTNRLEYADLEAFIESYPESVTILLQSDTSSGEFIFNPDGMKKIVSDEVKLFLENEEEVISTGNVVITKAAFYYDEEDPYDSEDVHQFLIKAIKGSKK